MFEIDSTPNPEERWGTVREQMAVIAYTIQSSTFNLWGIKDLNSTYRHYHNHIA